MSGIGINTWAATVTNEYWLDDLSTGSNEGTLHNPYIGSGTNFDYVMATLTAKSNIVIHLLPGTYRTAGYQPGYSAAFQIRSGTRLLGSGIDVSIIKLNDNPGINAVVVGTATGVTNVEIADLTLDANGSTSTNKWTHGIGLYGNKSAVRRVKVINTIGDGALLRESFPIYVRPLDSGGSTSDGSGNTIESCEVSSVLGDYVSGIVIAGGSGMIVNNRVYLPVNVGMAYNCGGSRNLRIIGNYSESGAVGYYSDTANTTDILFAHNSFLRCNEGIIFNHLSSSLDNVRIMDNNIVLATNLTGGIRYGIASYGYLTNVYIVGNVISEVSPGTANMRAVGWAPATGAVVTGNRWDGTMTCYLNASSVNLSVFGNFDLFGNLLTNVNQVAPANGSVRRTISSTGTHTITLADRHIGVQVNGGVTVNLPTASGTPGKEIIVSAETSSPSITISPLSGQNINNSSSSHSISTAYTSKRFISDGTQWFTY